MDNNKFPEYKKLCHHSGQQYHQFLKRFHDHIKPKSYLEIGVSTGKSLSLSECRSVGVDPQFKLDRSVTPGKRFVALVQETSDDFFEKYDPIALLGKRPDFVFLDGMHQSEYLFRDFMNTERISSPDTVVAIHDCLPEEIFCARRDQNDAEVRSKTPTPAKWAGDVWKVIFLLKKYRSDLQIIGFDSPPTGIVIVRNLNPRSNILFDKYDEIIDELNIIENSSEVLNEFLLSMNIMSTDDLEDTLSLNPIDA